MEPETASEVTGLLRAIDAGDQAAHDRLLPLVYDELRRLARAKLAREPRDHTLQPTALVHEAYLRFIAASGPWKDRTHFFSAAALAMRRILIDHARRRGMVKRGRGGVRVSLSEGHVVEKPRDVEIIALEEALADLDAKDSRLCHVVSLRYLAGLEIEEIAQLLAVSPATVKRDWVFARAWLKNRLTAAT